jgi:hypothetical protein
MTFFSPFSSFGTGGGGVTSSIVWKGTWSASVYDELDAVEHEGSAYIANAATETTDEPGVSSKWDLWIAQGPAWELESDTVLDFGTT